MIVRRGRYQVVAVWNWPVVTFTWLLCRYRPQDDPRAFFVRWRVGPWKIQVEKQR